MKQKDFHTVVLILLGVIIFFTFTNQCTSCRNKSDIQNLSEQLSISDSIHDIRFNNINDKTEDKLLNDINNATLSRNILYDWNAIVRTVTRPDDKMNYYNQLIEDATNQLNEYRKGK